MLKKQRLAFIFILSLSLPFLVLGLYAYRKLSHIRSWEQEISVTARSLEKDWKALDEENFLRKQHEAADRFYVDQSLESLEFLKGEKKILQEWVHMKDCGSLFDIYERMRFLEKNDNHLLFVEGDVYKSRKMRESTETLSKAVELDLDDLERLFAHLEGQSSLPSPHFVILDMSLERKSSSYALETYVLTSLRLLKREFLS